MLGILECGLGACFCAAHLSPGHGLVFARGLRFSPLRRGHFADLLSLGLCAAADVGTLVRSTPFVASSGKEDVALAVVRSSSGA